MTSLLFTLLPLLAASVLLFLKVVKIGSRPAGYPPGPPTVPLLGNLHLVRRKNINFKMSDVNRFSFT
jgi:hypothetical protein